MTSFRHGGGGCFPTPDGSNHKTERIQNPLRTLSKGSWSISLVRTTELLVRREFERAKRALRSQHQVCASRTWRMSYQYRGRKFWEEAAIFRGPKALDTPNCWLYVFRLLHFWQLRVQIK